jgi:dUTP pyrophosphatase
MFRKEITVKIKKFHDGDKPYPQTPFYATPGSAGVDLCACLHEDVTVLPGERAKIPTGIAIELPGSGVVALICARSGLAAKAGITLTNAVGVIDSDYRGEIQVLIINHGSEPFIIKHGDRIAQMLFIPVFLAKLVECSELAESERGSGGFGSTGI